MNRCLHLLAASLLLVTTATACRADDDKMAMPAAAAPAAKTPVATDQVSIDNFTFSPQVVTVAAGTTVTWKNKDDIPHLVVLTDQRARSPALDTEQSYSYKFDKPGTYGYFCGMHPKMTGTVIVTATPAARSK